MNPTPRRRRPTRSVGELKANKSAASAASAHAPRTSSAQPARRNAASPRSSGTARAMPSSPRRVTSRERAAMLERRRRRARGQAMLGLLALILMLALIAVGIKRCTGAEPSPSDTEPPVSGTDAPVSSGDASGSTGDETDAPTVPTFTVPGEVESRYLLLIDRETGSVVAEKNADARAYPASVTKIMTVLVALEQIDDPSKTVTITAALLDRLYALGASRAGFVAGEKVSATDLMYASLLPSGADGSVGLAELVSGSEEAFVKLMNDKARELGMLDTHFVNATGLHDDDHYSTCTDLAILLDYALENEEFRAIFTTAAYRSSATAEHPSGIRMTSTMRMYLSECQIERGYLLGGKTGYTSKAGLCLASLAEHDGKEYILVTLGAGDGVNYPRYQVQDAVAIFDAFFAKLG